MYLPCVCAGTHIVWDLVSRVSQPPFDPPAVEHDDVRHDGCQNDRNKEKHHGVYDPCPFVLFYKTHTRKRRKPSITTLRTVHYTLEVVEKRTILLLSHVVVKGILNFECLKHTDRWVGEGCFYRATDGVYKLSGLTITYEN